MKYKILLGSALLALSVGIVSFEQGKEKGLSMAGISYEKMISDEIDPKEFSQYMSPSTTIEEALSSGLYSHCVSYPGVGLVLQGLNKNNNWVVAYILGGSALDKAKPSIQKGDILLTPLSVIKGDLNSPLKIEYVSKQKPKDEIKTVLVTRKTLVKCYLKQKRVDDEENLQVY